MAEFFEFFAGGGMVRAGLGDGWTCTFANDIDPKKAAAYRRNFGARELKVADVREVTLDDLPGTPDLVWASFPCQDLSLAGAGAGLNGDRSGSFYPFWGVMKALVRDGRAPKVIALENVCGAITSHGGRDFQALCATFTDTGYRVGALAIDAELFVPQSRARLFLIGVQADVVVGPTLQSVSPTAPFHTSALCRAVASAPEAVRSDLLWWRLPLPRRRARTLLQVLETEPSGLSWHTPAETTRLISLMSPLHRAKLDAATRSGRPAVGSVYRRTRVDDAGRKMQRAEVRFDDVAGCLRTPAGGSSRQTIIVVDGDRVRSRLISARETARLMGLPDDYQLPENYTEAYHLTGDGVAVDVVRHLARHLFEPLIGSAAEDRCAAA